MDEIPSPKFDFNVKYSRILDVEIAKKDYYDKIWFNIFCKVNSICMNYVGASLYWQLVGRCFVGVRPRARAAPIAARFDKKLGHRLIILNVVPTYAYRFWMDLC